MARPEHRTLPGATYFVTTNTWQRREIFRKTPAAEALVEKLFEYRQRGFYLLHCFVVMPDHLHVILTPGQNASLERAVQMIKGGSSREIGLRLRARFPVWQSGFTEHQIRGGEDYELHARYVHSNPVKAGLARDAAEYAFSSLRHSGCVDPWPLASGAEAPARGEPATAGLKPRPSRDKEGDRDDRQSRARAEKQGQRC